MDAVTAFAFLVGLVVLGNALGQAGVLPEATPAVLNQVVLTLCLPASILLHAPGLRVDAGVAAMAVLPWLLGGLSALIVLGLGRALRWPRETSWLLVLAIALGNTSFLGYPLLGALLGPAALPHAVVYDQLGTFLMMSSVGIVILARVGAGGDPSPRATMRRIVGFPPFIALVVALTVMPAESPAPVEAVLARLADALLPLVALAIGVQLRLRLPREHLAPLAAGLAGKLVMLPAMAWPIAWLLGLDGIAFDVAVLESAMPTMITAMALAAAAGLAPRLAAALVGYGIVLSALTIPAWAWLLARF
jgi:predicted permease